MDNIYTCIHIGLDEFIQVLDTRLEKSTVPNPGLVAKKVREVGDPSLAVHQLMHKSGQCIPRC